MPAMFFEPRKETDRRTWYAHRVGFMSKIAKYCCTTIEPIRMGIVAGQRTGHDAIDAVS